MTRAIVMVTRHRTRTGSRLPAWRGSREGGWWTVSEKKWTQLRFVPTRAISTTADEEVKFDRWTWDCPGSGFRHSHHILGKHSKWRLLRWIKVSLLYFAKFCIKWISLDLLLPSQKSKRKLRRRRIIASQMTFHLLIASTATRPQSKNWGIHFAMDETIK